ncbi:MAG: orotate phosphoribosyltransferase [Acidimicrobiales bacterium]
MSGPPNGLPRYRLLTGPDDSSFCERVSEMLALGYELHGGPSVAAGPDGTLAAQAVLWPDAGVSRSELASRIHELAHLEGSFLLRSGVTADVYFDKYQFEAQPDTLRQIAAELVPLVPDGTELLAGLELGGVPIATALSLHTGIPAVFVRKQAKSYGTAKLAEGPSIEGRRLLVVEDVVTSGGQIVESVGQLRELGAIIERAVCVIDREQGGAANLAEIGVELRPLFTRSELEA